MLPSASPRILIHSCSPLLASLVPRPFGSLKYGLGMGQPVRSLSCKSQFFFFFWGGGGGGRASE